MSKTIVVALPTTLLSLVFSGKLADRFGKKPLYVFGGLLGGIIPLIRLIDVTNPTLVLLSSALGGLGSGLLVPLMMSINADNIDYVEYAQGHRAEGAVASLTSFISKAGSGVGSALSGYILAATGYVANVQQTETAIMGIILVTIIVPAALSLIAGTIFACFYKLNKSALVDMNNELKARRKRIEEV